jgi:DNA-binding CsgD family transcriptional regulator
MSRTTFSETELYAVAQLLRDRMTHAEIAARLGWSNAMVARICPAARRRWPDELPIVVGSIQCSREEYERREALLREVIDLLRDGYHAGEVKQRLGLTERRYRNLLRTARRRGVPVQLPHRVEAKRKRHGSPIWEISRAINVGSLVATQLRQLNWLVGEPIPESMARSVFLSQQGRIYGVRPAQIVLWLNHGWDPNCGKPMLHSSWGRPLSKRLLREVASFESKQRRLRKRERKRGLPASVKRAKKLDAKKRQPKPVPPPQVQQGPTGIEGEVLELLQRAPMPLSAATISRRLDLDAAAALEALRELCVLRKIRIAGEGPNGTTFKIMEAT